jgi:hypothetical protein
VRAKYIALIICWLFGGAALLDGGPAHARKRKESPCSKPLKIISRQPLPRDERDKAKRMRVQGTVEIEISEDGDIAKAKVVNPSSKETARILFDMVKGMKFERRSGCGAFKTTVNFTLSE